MNLSINIDSEASFQAVPNFNIGRGRGRSRGRGRGRGRGRAGTGRGIGRGGGRGGSREGTAETVELPLIRRIYKDGRREHILCNKLILVLMIGIQEADEGS